MVDEVEFSRGRPENEPFRWQVACDEQFMVEVKEMEEMYNIEAWWRWEDAVEMGK